MNEHSQAVLDRVAKLTDNHGPTSIEVWASGAYAAVAKTAMVEDPERPESTQHLLEVLLATAPDDVVRGSMVIAMKAIIAAGVGDDEVDV